MTARPPPGGGQGLPAPRTRGTLFILCAQVLVLHVGQSLIVPILPLYVRSFEVSAAVVGLLLAAQAVPRMFANVPAGHLADRFGAHRTLVAACAIATVAALGSAAAPSFLFLLACRVVQGIGSAVSHTSGLTYAASLGRPERRGRAVSLYQGSFLLGNGIGPVLGGLIAEHLGYRAPFWLYAGVAAVTGLLMLVLLPDPRAALRTPDPTAADAAPADGTAPGGTLADGPPPEHRGGAAGRRALALLADGGILLACGLTLLSGYTRSGSRDYALVLLASEQRIPESQIGMALTVIFLANVAVLYLAGWLTDRFGPRPVLVPGWALVAGGLALLAGAGTYPGLLGAAALYGLGAGIANAVPAIQIANAVGTAERGLALGLMRTFSDLGLIAGPLLMGWMAVTAGLAWGVWLNAALAFLAAAAFAVYGPAGRQATRP